jgi:methionyl-tRNA synthetase
MAASMYCTWYAAREPTAATDEHWHAGHAAKLVYFLGFDNAYFWGMTHLALLMAHDGRYIEPDTIVCNEFYELENEKFSTSRGHVIWTPDLLAEVPRDLVRFYLALTCPEHARTNFSRAALDKVTRARLVEPWNRLAAHLDRLVAAEGTGPLAVSDAGRRAAAVLAERFAACYELPTYSLYRAADAIAYQVDRLARRAAGGDAGAGRSGDLLLSVRTLLACAAPLLVDVAATARAAGVDLTIGGIDNVTAIAPFRLPLVAAPTPSTTGDLVGVGS